MTSKIGIRELRDSDSAHFMRWINDRDLVRFNSSYAPVSEGQHRDWFAAVARRKDMRIFTIALEQDGASLPIGSCSLRNIDMLTRSAELQIRIGEANHRGRGLGRRVVGLLLDHGFGDMNLNRIHLEVLVSNIRAIRVYRDCGFLEEGTRRQAAFRDGAYQDILLMAILKSEHEARRDAAQ